MSVSGVSGAASSQAADAAEDARTILVMKKQLDVQKDQAAALLDLVKQSTDVGRLIDVRG